MRIKSGPIKPFKSSEADKITEGAGFSTTSQLRSAAATMIGSAVVDRKLKAAPKLKANAMNGIGSHGELAVEIISSGDASRARLAAV
jgi:hypothetical protein